MQFLDTVLPTAAENIALDEALLERAETASPTGHPDVLRIWECPEVAVVVGRSSRTNREVDLTHCEADGIPVLRRCSGGAAVVIGPGCLMYSVVLSYQKHPALRRIELAHRVILGRLVAAISTDDNPVAVAGTSDLVLGDRKFSGNSLRCKRRNLLYHGTLLYNFPLQSISDCLQAPPRQPNYRGDRSHNQFVTNLPASGEGLREVLRREWNATDAMTDWPKERTHQLMMERYTQADWNHSR